MRSNSILIMLLAGIILAGFSACGNPAGTVQKKGETTAFTSFTGTYWTDMQTPKNTMTFGDATVVLDGDATVPANLGYWDMVKINNVSVKGQSLLFTQDSDFSHHMDKPAVQVWTNKDLGQGFAIYYLAAMPAEGKAERAIVYITGVQPREFYRP
jgi:hypothetical protein